MQPKRGDQESFDRQRKQEEAKAAEEARMRAQMGALMAKQRGSGESGAAGAAGANGNGHMK